MIVSEQSYKRVDDRSFGFMSFSLKSPLPFALGVPSTSYSVQAAIVITICRIFFGVFDPTSDEDTNQRIEVCM